eukprot:60945-Hanusia_phi.AAC.1
MHTQTSGGPAAGVSEAAMPDSAGESYGPGGTRPRPGVKLSLGRCHESRIQCGSGPGVWL